MADEEARRAIVAQIVHGSFTYKQIKDAEVAPGAARLALRADAARARPARARALRAARRPQGEDHLHLRQRADDRRAHQDLYGVTNLTVAKGRSPVTIQVLAPNNRPVQITSDLANFWKESYPKIKQELARKYPKHEWR